MVHLHTCSCYSLLESPFRLEQIVECAKQNGFRHACLTDKNSMFGTVPFYNLCKENNIHPILGLEVDSYIQEDVFSFVLLAKNDMGLQSLYKLSSYLMCNDIKLDFYELSKYSKECIVITSGSNDTLDSYIAHDEKENVLSFLNECKDQFDDFYVSISMNDSKYRALKNQNLKEWAHEVGCTTVALSRIYYATKEGVQDQRILKAIAKQTTIHNQSLDVLYDRYYRSQEEMEKLYDANDLEVSESIARQCNVQMAMPKSKLPHFENKLGIDSKSYLIKLCKAGLLKRLNNQVTNEYVKRLEYELNVINSMGFTDYFLIVYDFIRYARSEDIYVGPGRGSAAGSLVAYCLGITHVDPIKNNLLFERFLNPDRITMPDIDVDFPNDRRDEVIQYVTKRYGSSHVSHVLAFDTLSAKQVLRDVARVIEYPLRKVDELNTTLSRFSKITLKQAYQEVPAFRRIIDTDAKAKELYSICLRLEGLPRHTTVHAGGVVLSDQDIVNVSPLVRVDEENLATQLTKDDLEQFGLIKMDMLAIRNLTTIYEVVQSLKAKNISIDVLKLPFNDAKTYRLLSSGDTIGVFQLESQGIKNLLRRLKPSKFEDISAVLALYRPGAMQNIDEYIKRKNDPSMIVYPHELTKPFLKETYGLMIYQEQVMQMATTIGGFTLAQADTLRKAISKKNPELLESFKSQFIQGALKNRLSTKQATSLFDMIEKFGGYGFNKSHSYAYGMICYQQAYLKANYPLDFYQKLLDSVIGSEKKSEEYIHECQKRNIKILPCDVSKSEASYTIENDGLRMPLQVLKGIGKSIYPIILKEREKASFKDANDFVIRCSAAGLSESSMRILIDGGALDCLEYNRATWNENLSKILDYAGLVKVSTKDEILFDYSIVSPPAITKMKENPLLKAQRERQVYGFYLTLHPVQNLRQKYPKCVPLNQLLMNYPFVEVIGQVSGYRNHKTKNGDMMCFMTIQDENAKIDITIMPNLYALEKENIQRNRIVHVQGKKDRETSILARKIEWIEFEDS